MNTDDVYRRMPLAFLILLLLVSLLLEAGRGWTWFQGVFGKYNQQLDLILLGCLLIAILVGVWSWFRGHRASATVREVRAPSEKDGAPGKVAEGMREKEAAQDYAHKLVRSQLPISVIAAAIVAAVLLYLPHSNPDLRWWLYLLYWMSAAIALASIVAAALALLDVLFFVPDSENLSENQLKEKKATQKRNVWLLFYLIVGVIGVIVTIAANQNGALGEVKEALQKRTALFLFLFLAMFGIYPLTYLAYRAFGESTHRKQISKDFLLLGLEEKREVENKVTELYETVYSPIQFAVYISVIGLVTACVLYLHFACPATLIKPGSDPCPSPLSGLTPLQASSVFFAFLGAFVFSVQELVRRYNTYDLQPQVYASVAVRMLIAIGIVYVVQLILPAEGEDKGIWAAVAFIIGIFPTQGLQFLSQTASKRLSGKVPEHTLLPLGNLLGISAFHESRLLQMGIDDAQNLANADLKRLLLTTQFDSEQIVNWVDQAILYSKVGERIQRFREVGIHGNHQMELELRQTRRYCEEYTCNAPSREETDGKPTTLDDRRTGGDGSGTPVGNESDVPKVIQKLVDTLSLKGPEELCRLVDSSSYPNAAHVENYFKLKPLEARQKAFNSMCDELMSKEIECLDRLIDISNASMDVPTLDKRSEELLKRLVEGHGQVVELLKDGELKKENAAQYHQLGKGQAYLGKFLNAMESLNKAIECDRNLASAYASRALVHVKANKIDEALYDVSKSITLDGSAVDAWHNRGIIYLKAGRSRAAIGDLDVALKRNPHLGIAYLHRGIARQQTGDYQAAIYDLEFAEVLGVDSPELHATWGLASFMLQGTGEEAKANALTANERLSRAIDSERKACSEYFFARCLVRERLGDSEGADDDLVDAIRRATEEGNEWLVKVIAWDKVKKQRFAEAIGHLKQFLGEPKNTGSMEARVLLALLLETGGKTGGACEQYTEIAKERDTNSRYSATIRIASDRSDLLKCKASKERPGAES